MIQGSAKLDLFQGASISSLPKRLQGAISPGEIGLQIEMVCYYIEPRAKLCVNGYVFFVIQEKRIELI